MKRILLVAFAVFMAETMFGQKDVSVMQTPDQILEQVFVKDQTMRRQMDSLYAVGASVDEILPVATRVAMDDIENQQTALPLLERYLSNEISLSDNSLRTLFYVIQHADFDIQAKYKDFIYGLYPREVISGTEYAFFVDRLNVGQNRAQVYGCQVYMNGNIHDRFFYPIMTDPDVRRSEVGLPDFDVNMGDAFTGDYAPVFVSPGEFVILGHIQSVDANGKLSGIQATIKFGKFEIRTNANGFYSVKFPDRTSVPGRMRVVADDKKCSKRIKLERLSDWQIIDVNIPAK